MPSSHDEHTNPRSFVTICFPYLALRRKNQQTTPREVQNYRPHQAYTARQTYLNTNANFSSITTIAFRFPPLLFLTNLSIHTKISQCSSCSLLFYLSIFVYQLYQFFFYIHTQEITFQMEVMGWLFTSFCCYTSLSLSETSYACS